MKQICNTIDITVIIFYNSVPVVICIIVYETNKKKD